MAISDGPLVTIEALPAGHGDALWVDVHGDPPWRLLIDGGTPGTAVRVKRRINARLDDRPFDLFVVTHIDIDHIGGAVKLLRAHRQGLAFGDIWFNGPEHLDPASALNRGARQGEELAALLTGRAASEQLPWNVAFGGAAVMTGSDGEYLRHKAAPGVEIILLSPPPENLARLRPAWDKEMAALRSRQSNDDTDRRAGTRRGTGRSVPDRGLSFREIASMATDDDTAVANGSSIAFLLRVERDGRRRSVLLAGDAHPAALGAALWQLAQDEGSHRVAVDVFKLPHHCSQANVTEALLNVVDADHYLVSTNGAYFGHPDPAALERIATRATERTHIWFNYDKPSTRWFRDRCAELGVEIHVPSTPDAGAVLTL